MEAKDVFPVVCKAEVEAFVGKTEELTTTAPVSQVVILEFIDVVSVAIVANDVFPVVCKADVEKPVIAGVAPSCIDTFKFPLDKTDGKITLLSMEAKDVFPVVCKAEVEAPVAKAVLETTTAPVLQATTLVSKLVVSPAIVANEVFPVSCLASVANPEPEALTTAVVSNFPLASIESDCHLLDVLEP